VKRTIPPFRSGPWTATVPPERAQDVDGVPVVERLAARPDAPGVLVRLANGRLAVLGDVLAVGRPVLLRLFAQRRAADSAASDADRAWWAEVRRHATLRTPAGLLDAAGPCAA
jgi:hypothetical protein